MLSRRLFLLAAVGLAAATSVPLAGCENPLYWFVQPRKLYVAVSSTHALYVEDRGGLRSTWQQVWLSDAPTRLAYVPSRDEILALEPSARAVQVISEQSNSVVATVGTSGQGTDLTVSSDGADAFVADSTDETVTRINLQTLQVDKTFSYTASNFVPVAIAGHPTRASDVYVVSSTGLVSVIRGDVQDATSFQLTGAQKPSRIVAGINQDFYVTDSGSSYLYHITNPDNPTVDQIPLSAAGGSAYSAAVAPDGTVYLSIPSADKIDEIAETSHTEVPYDSGGSSPEGIAADSSGVYIANEGSNQVAAMVFSGSDLLQPQIMDTLPGPPVDILAI